MGLPWPTVQDLTHLQRLVWWRRQGKTAYCLLHFLRGDCREFKAIEDHVRRRGPLLRAAVPTNFTENLALARIIRADKHRNRSQLHYFRLGTWALAEFELDFRDHLVFVPAD